MIFCLPKLEKGGSRSSLTALAWLPMTSSCLVANDLKLMRERDSSKDGGWHYDPYDVPIDEPH